MKLIRTTTITLMLAFAALALPSTAAAGDPYAVRCTPDRASCGFDANQWPDFTGWVQADGISCTALANVPCDSAYTAWQYGATGWTQTRVPGAQWIYLYPYAPGWRWAWYRNSWHAMPTRTMDPVVNVIRRVYTPWSQLTAGQRSRVTLLP